MDLVNNSASIIAEEEDRISKLPDDVIHCILSLIDMTYAIQTSILSKRWKHTWTSMPCLNLNSRPFRSMPQFAQFVKHVLSRRNNRTDVSTLDLRFSGPTTQPIVKEIVNYAYVYSVRKLTMKWSTNIYHELPQSLFSSRTLKHLTLNDKSTLVTKRSSMPKSAWEFPVLETLNMSDVILRDLGDKNTNLFNKCVNLKELALHKCCSFRLEIFNVCAPQLQTFTVTDSITFPKVFNLVSPKLKNLTASITTHEKIYNEGGTTFLPFSIKGFNSLEKVNLSFGLGDKKENHGPRLPDLFRKLSNATILILDMDIIETLSSCNDEIFLEPGPFNKLKCLKINSMPLKQNERLTTIPVKIKNYLLQNSGSVDFIMNLPQKRLGEKEEKYTMVKVPRLEAEKKQRETNAIEKRMLETKIQMQDQVIAQQRAKIQMIERNSLKIQMQDQVIAQQKEKIQMQDQDMAKQKTMFEELKLQHDSKMEELKVLVESKNPDYEIIRSIVGDLKSIRDMRSLRVAVKARLSSLYEGFKSLFLTHIDASQWETLEAELGELPRSLSADKATSSSIDGLGSNIDVQPSQSSRE